MKQIAAIAVLMLTSCANAQDPRQAGPGHVDENLTRGSARVAWTNTLAADYAAACYVSAVNDRRDGLTASAELVGAGNRWRVTLVMRNQAVGIISLVQVGTGSSAELFVRPGSIGSVQGFRRFLAERC